MIIDELLEERKILVKSIFKGKSVNWIDNNIIILSIDKKNLLTCNDFKKMILKDKLTLYQLKLLILWTGYSYYKFDILGNLMSNLIYPERNESKNLSKYYIYSKDNNIYITFRGTKTFWELINGLKFYRVKFSLFNKTETKNFFNWRNNFLKSNIFNEQRIPLINDTEIEIHKGFLEEANNIFPLLIKNITPLIKNKKRPNFILCGHSLGGVLATIIGIYLAYNYKKKCDVSILNFNMPPIGNKNFNLIIPYLNIKNFIRLYNYQDFVPYYGYLGTWIESKKFRHIDFMLKNGIINSNESNARFIDIKMKSTHLYIRDFGKNLDKYLLNGENMNNRFNYKYIFHDFIKLCPDYKTIFI